MRPTQRMLLHAVLLTFVLLTLLPFLFVANNALRRNSEIWRSFFSPPDALVAMVEIAGNRLTDVERTYMVPDSQDEPATLEAGEAFGHHAAMATRGMRQAWSVIRPQIVNSLIVSGLSALGVLLIGSVAAYILARYRFMGSKAIFMLILSTMMFPGVLTLVPSFMLVRSLNLLDTYWAMILPYVATGQVFAIFVFKSFFENLPEELFEAARLDGAGHLRLYWHLILPLSKPVFAVVMVMNILGTWNNFLWPFIVNPEGKYHVITSGLYVLTNSAFGLDESTVYSAYLLSSLPLLCLFLLSSRVFIKGLTTGALKT